jgi:hypothetical protein
MGDPRQTGENLCGPPMHHDVDIHGALHEAVIGITHAAEVDKDG